MNQRLEALRLWVVYYAVKLLVLLVKGVGRAFKEATAARHFGKISGVDVYVDGTVTVLVGLMTVIGLRLEGLAGLMLPLTLVIAYGCVTLHEFGHILAARRYGIACEHVTLYAIGGVAKIAGFPSQPYQEFVIAIAGPAVNFAIAAIMVIPALVYHHSGAQEFFDINLRLGLFNLLPFFPMDGGRILRSLTWLHLGELSGTVLAARVGQIGGVLFLLAGCLIPAPNLLIIGPLLFLGCLYEISQMRKKHAPPEPTGEPHVSTSDRPARKKTIGPESEGGS